MSTFSISFKDAAELIDFATKFIVGACNAPFPALLYCFSIIDLLGALYAGHAKSGQTTSDSERYMKHFLRYPQDKPLLLQIVLKFTTTVNEFSLKFLFIIQRL